jgi:hypothetical protein
MVTNVKSREKKVSFVRKNQYKFVVTRHHIITTLFLSSYHCTHHACIKFWLCWVCGFYILLFLSHVIRPCCLSHSFHVSLPSLDVCLSHSCYNVCLTHLCFNVCLTHSCYNVSLIHVLMSVLSHSFMYTPCTVQTYLYVNNLTPTTDQT